MAQVHDQPTTVAAAPDGTTVQELARRLAANGLAVQCSRRRDTWQLIILGVASGKSHLTVSADGHAHWYYEPAAGPSTSAATLTAIVAYLLGAPGPTTSPAAYRAFPLKGQVGRSLQDMGLTVTLHISEDLESFEATTQIQVTSPAHPRLGTVSLADDAGLDWHCDWRTAVGHPAKLADVIAPILRAADGVKG
jgi:hypothetical protein